MVHKIIHDGPINTAVMAWMRGQGIKPEDVRGYTLTYDAGKLMTIDIRMLMEDVVPAPKRVEDRDEEIESSGPITVVDVARRTLDVVELLGCAVYPDNMYAVNYTDGTITMIEK